MNLLANGSRDADAAGKRKRFQARSDVDAIPRDVVAVHDDVADVDADPQPHAVVGAAFGFASGEIALNVERAAQRVRCAREFDEKSVTRRLHETTTVRVDLRLRDGVAQVLQPREGRRLVALHQTTEAGDVGHHDCRELAWSRLPYHDPSRSGRVPKNFRKRLAEASSPGRASISRSAACPC